MPWVKIVHPETVEWSLDNGFSVRKYRSGEFYEMPEFVYDGMKRYGWVELVDPDSDEIPRQEAPPAKDASPLQQPEPTPTGEPEDVDLKPKKRGK